MTHFETDEALVARCERVRNAARDSLSWAMGTENETVRAKPGLERKLRKAVVNASKLVDAASRRTCVGVFGASQAGKSFLISALARKGEERLMAMFGDKPIDFIARINPEGNKESTGVVTRFSCHKPDHLPAGHPVHLGLLTEIDIVQILVNSFAFDLSHGRNDENEEENQEEHLQEIQSVLNDVAAQKGQKNHLTCEDVYEINEYVRRLQASSDKYVPRLDALKRTAYWEEMESCLPFLQIAERIKLYSLLWEELDIYSTICRDLLEELAKLDYQRDVYASPEALFIVEGDEWKRSPDKSIINVSALKGIGNPSSDQVSVVTSNGMSAQVKRACLTGLIAELNIVMQDQPFDFFEHTDLLDFPGARTRKPVGKDPEILNDPENATENFLRGKVAYLFQRYCNEHELNAMILTVGPSNQEVADLAKMIEAWIEKTHGTTPESRKNVENALFFVFSKFDMSFERGAGKEVSPERWSTRLEASLLKPFGGAHSNKTDWVKNWTPGHPFNNSFWIRNPNLRAGDLFKYEGDDHKFREVGFLNEDVEHFIKDMFDAYMQCETVQHHFSDPKGAWDPCMAFNDGGVTRLARSLAPVCRPELKRAQVAQRLNLLGQDLEEEMSRFYISGDLETVRKEKTEIAKGILKSLADCWRAEKFGYFLHALKLNENNAVDTYMATERAAAAVAVQSASITKTNVSANDDILSALGFDEEDIISANNADDGEKENGGENITKDVAEKFAENIESMWREQVREIAHNESYTSYLGISSEGLMKLANELMLLAHRVGLFKEIIATVRQQYLYKISPREAWIWRQVAPACHMFNAFFMRLGTAVNNERKAVQVTNMQDQAVTAFEPAEEVCGLLSVEEKSDDFSTKSLIDYLNVLQHQIKGNAQYQIGFVGNAEENARLGKILNTLKG